MTLGLHPQRVACYALAVLLCGCSDGATRIAFDIESAVAAFQSSDARTYSIKHVPKSIPEGCAGSYTVQLGANSSLVIWCKKSGKVTSSYSTTYHLRFVKVPQTFKLDKAAGEATIIELARENGAVLVTAVR
jgi:hypothetical protein